MSCATQCCSWSDLPVGSWTLTVAMGFQLGSYVTKLAVHLCTLELHLCYILLEVGIPHCVGIFQWKMCKCLLEFQLGCLWTATEVSSEEVQTHVGRGCDFLDVNSPWLVISELQSQVYLLIHISKLRKIFLHHWFPFTCNLVNTLMSMKRGGYLLKFLMY